MNKVYKKANILYVPALMLLLMFVVYPFFDGLRIAFTDWNGYSQSYRYIGFENFRRIFTDANLLVAIRNTLAYGFGSTFLQHPIVALYLILQKYSIKGMMDGAIK